MTPESVRALLRALGPVLLRGIAAGTLAEILDAAIKLLALLRPLLAPVAAAPATVATAETAPAARPHPAQPEDPAMTRAAGH